mgnify:CR=1 FL=1
MKTNNFVIATVVIAIATALCGCPQNGMLTPFLHTETEDGQSALVTLNQVDEVYAPYGALVTYEGGKGFKEAEATIYLQNVPEPIVQRLTRTTATGSEEKCLSCATAAHLVIAGAIATTSGVIALVSESEDSFDIAVPTGGNLATCILRVVGRDGSFAITTFRGLAYYDDIVPEEESFVLSREISPIEGGRIVVNPDYEAYWPGEEVQVTAVTNPGYEFSHWMVNGELGIEDPVAYVTMDSDVQLVAVFTAINPEPEEGEPVEGEPVEGEGETDTTPPVITLISGKYITLNVGDVWNDPGAVAIDEVDGEVPVYISGTVDTSMVGIYELTYAARDRSDNLATVTRTVTVTDTGSVDGLKVALTWNAGTNTLVFDAAEAPAGVVGLELYHTAGGTPWTERETFAVNSNGDATGIITKFRASASRTLRFSVVTSATSGGYVPHDAVTVTLNGVNVALVDDGTGNVAFQVTIP